MVQRPCIQHWTWGKPLEDSHEYSSTPLQSVTARIIMIITIICFMKWSLQPYLFLLSSFSPLSFGRYFNHNFQIIYFADPERTFCRILRGKTSKQADKEESSAYTVVYFSQMQLTNSKVDCTVCENASANHSLQLNIQITCFQRKSFAPLTSLIEPHMLSLPSHKSVHRHKAIC